MDRSTWRGGLLALGAAVLFGASTPLIKHWSEHSGPFWTATLLYAGAALAGWLLQRPVVREAALRREHLPRLMAMALLGAALGPAAFAWGLQRTSAASASLVLVLEAVFTAVFARLAYREVLGRRVLLALALMTVGGAALVLDGSEGGTARLLGLTAVCVATLAWALDNTLSRRLADLDPGRVVLGKSVLGALVTALLGVATGQDFPAMAAALALVGIGATGYGLSLRLYLLAQRAFGAARTGSVFAFAPFAGAALALVIGGGMPGPGLQIAGVLMLAGVLLHLTEAHAHERP